MQPIRHYTPLDRLITGLDDLLKAGVRGPDSRSYPAAAAEEAPMTTGNRRLSARLLRVDHAGEVSAQALYLGQGLTAVDPRIRETLRQSAREEVEHLNWCRRRLAELGSRPSYLNPAWFTGALTMGALAGLAGDRWSLGFLAETERQVVRHLDSHLARLPREDHRSRLILERMRLDEGRHAAVAVASGAAELPRPLRGLMTLCSRVMTGTAFWI